jgi:hypothetical protein
MKGARRGGNGARAARLYTHQANEMAEASYSEEAAPRLNPCGAQRREDPEPVWHSVSPRPRSRNWRQILARLAPRKD